MFQAKNSVFPFPFLSPPPQPTGGREKGKEKLDFAARTLSLNKQYLHSSHQICVEKYYLLLILKIILCLLISKTYGCPYRNSTINKKN